MKKNSITAESNSGSRLNSLGRSQRVMSVREILTDETGVDALQANDETFN